MTPLPSRQTLAALSRIHCEAFGPMDLPGWSIESIAGLLQPNHAQLFLCCDEKSSESGPVGFAILHALEDMAELVTICVDPSHRRRGHGRKLLTKIEEVLENTPIRSILMEVETTNHHALLLYEAFGYSVISIRRGYYRHASGSIDAKVMQKMLR